MNTSEINYLVKRHFEYNPNSSNTLLVLENMALGGIEIQSIDEVWFPATVILAVVMDGSVVWSADQNKSLRVTVADGNRVKNYVHDNSMHTTCNVLALFVDNVPLWEKSSTVSA